MEGGNQGESEGRKEREGESYIERVERGRELGREGGMGGLERKRGRERDM